MSGSDDPRQPRRAMSIRVVAGLVAATAVALAIYWLPIQNGPVVRIELLPSPELPRPCLIGAKRCLELAETPFAPCLISTAGCSQQWAVVPLRAGPREPVAVRLPSILP